MTKYDIKNGSLVMTRDNNLLFLVDGNLYTFELTHSDSLDSYFSNMKSKITYAKDIVEVFKPNKVADKIANH